MRMNKQPFILYDIDHAICVQHISMLPELWLDKACISGFLNKSRKLVSFWSSL